MWVGGGLEIYVRDGWMLFRLFTVIALQCLAGPIFVGVKLVGDTFVPAGEESTRVNTTDGTVRNKRLWWKCVIIIVTIIIIRLKGVHKHKHGIKQALGLSILFKYELLLVRRKSNGQVLISKIPSNTCYLIIPCLKEYGT